MLQNLQLFDVRHRITDQIIQSKISSNNIAEFTIWYVQPLYLTNVAAL